MPCNLENSTIEPIYNLESYAKEAKYKLQVAHKVAVELLEKIKLANKSNYDKSSNELNIKINDKVYVKKEPYDKYKPIYVGPYTVKNINMANVDILDQVTNKTKTVHCNRLMI